MSGLELLLLPIIPIIIAIIILIILIIIFLIWYFFFNDRDCLLALYERFGRGASKFSGKVVWLTGATSGLGEEMALQLAAVGAKLILSARNVDTLNGVKAICIEKSKGKLTTDDIFVLPFDITKVEEKFVDNAIDFFGQIDVLINNIGHVHLGEVVATDIEKDRAVLNVNFFGCIYLTKLLLRHFLQNGHGQIVVISSMAGKFGIPGQSSYAASKHALLGFFDSLRVEYCRYKIPVTVVCPGLFQSSLTPRASIPKKVDKISDEDEEKIRRNSMKASRCAKLALVAAANRLYECWIAEQPFLFAMAFSQYWPNFHKCVMNCIFTKKSLEKMYNGKWPTLCTWKPLIAI